MILLPIMCVLIIWAAMIYGFCSDDMDMGYFGRVYAGLAHGAITLLALGSVGGLLYVTALLFKELL